jgi:Putative auto-transporter adhesin, head GIN domain
MRTKLALIALSGFTVAAVCLGGAFALGGKMNIADAITSFGDSDLPRCEALTAQSATRSLPWDNSDTAGVAVPANVHYRRGQGDQLVVTGNSALVPHIEIVDGAVRLNCHIRAPKGVRFDVTLPGREFKGFSIAGVGDMTLDGLDQSDLAINVAGAGNIAASGKVESLELHVAGAGDAKLAQLTVDRVAVHVAGSSNIDVAPRDELEANIVGASTVVLHSEPRSIETHIIGSGRIVHPDGSVSGNNRHI